MPRGFSLVSFAFIALFSNSALALEPGRAEGTLKAPSETFKPKYAWAKTSSGSGETVVMLSDKPLAVSTLESSSDTLEKLDAQVWKIQIDEEGNFYLFSGRSGKSLSSGFEDEGSFVYTPIAVSAQSIQGRIASKKGLKHEWSFDLTFHAAYTDKDDVWGANPAVAKEFGARSAALADGAAKGTFVVGQNSLPLKYAYAKGKGGSDGKQDVTLFLVDRPIDAPQLQNEVLNDDVNGLVVAIASDGAIREIKWLHPDFNASDFGFDLGYFEPVVVANDRIEGRVYSVKDAEFRGTRYTYLADFKAPVQKYAKANEFKIDASNGKKLPKGGGDPGKAYVKYDKALRAKDVDGLLAIAGEEARQQFEAMTGGDKKQAVEMLELLNALRAKNIKVVDGYSDGDRASLYLEGDEEGTKTTGRVNMIKDGTSWHIAKEMWGSGID